MNYEIIKQVKFKDHVTYSITNERIDCSSYIFIVEKENKCGIINEDEVELVPCEYDNITFISCEIVQLVKNGKIGIAHIKESDDSSPLLNMLIPCEYDSLDYSKSMAVAVLRKDELTGQKCRAYFPWFDMLTDWYDSYEILGRGLVELRNPKENELYDAIEGKMILKHNNIAYHTFDVLLNEPDDPDDIYYEDIGVVIHTFGERDSVLFYDHKTVTQFFYNGDMHPIYGTGCFFEMDKPFVTGFVIEDKEKGLILLDKYCEPIRIDDPAWIKIKSQVEVYGSRYHEITEYPFSSNTISCENIVETLFGNMNDFLEIP